MAVLFIAVVFALAMVGIAVRANSRFRREERLPMQWLLSGSEPLSKTIVWSAPRPVALGFIPCLAVCSLTLFTVASMTLKARPGQEGYLIPILLIVGCVFVEGQRLHLLMITKTLRHRE